jgi:hypothetical protein
MVFSDQRLATRNNDQGAAGSAHIRINKHIMPLERNIELTSDCALPPARPDLPHQFCRILVSSDQFAI